MNKRGIKEPNVSGNLTVAVEAETLMREAKEQETEITELQFEKVFLTKFDGSHLSFKKVIFKNCKLMGCTFDEAGFEDVKFINCDFYNSSFNDAYFKCCSFRSCKTVGADFYGSRINHVTFDECYAADAGFDTARMSYVKAENTDFTEASFSKCRLIHVEWKNVCFEKANFFKTLLRGVDFSECNISGITLSDGKGELEGIIVNMFQAVELAKGMGMIIKETDLDEENS